MPKTIDPWKPRLEFLVNTQGFPTVRVGGVRYAVSCVTGAASKTTIPDQVPFRNHTWETSKLAVPGQGALETAR